MEKKRRITVFYILFFLIMLFFAAYVLLNFRGDYFAVIGTAVVLLISGYLMIDRVLWLFLDGNRNKEIMLEQTKTAEIEDTIACLKEIENIQKAIYAATKRNGAVDDDQLTKICDTLKQLEESVKQIEGSIVQLEESIVQLAKQGKVSYEGQQSALKLIVKYNKENARQIAENAHNNTEMVISEIYSIAEKLAFGAQPLVAATVEDPVTVSAPMPEPEPVMSKALQSMISDDPNKQLTPEEIAAMFDAAGQP